MAHKEQKDFVLSVKNKFPEYFSNKKVLDVGSFDVVGTESQFFDNCDFIGLDLGPGPGVDVICPAQDYKGDDNSFDTIISCECFEHNPFYKETIQNICRMLKPNGLFLFTCATIGRAVHGVQYLEEESKIKYDKWVTMPNVLRPDWDNNFYKNLTEEDIRSCINIESIFKLFEFQVEHNHHDLYFWGIKR